MLDLEGNIIENKDKVQILISKVEIDSTIVASVGISKI